MLMEISVLNGKLPFFFSGKEGSIVWNGGHFGEISVSPLVVKCTSFQVL